MALDGKIAVVTGGAMGIGKAMTEILVRNGAQVNLCLQYVRYCWWQHTVHWVYLQDYRQMNNQTSISV